MPLPFSQFYSASPGQPAPYMAQQQAQAALAEQQRMAAWIQTHPQQAEHLGLIESDWDRQVRERREHEQQMQERAEEIKRDYELKTSIEGKKRLSKLQNGFNAAVKSGVFNSSELDMMKKQVMIEAMDLPKNLIEKTEQQKQMEAWESEGKGIGQQWTDEMGNRVTRKPNGEIVTQVSWDKTPEATEKEIQFQAAKEQVREQAELAKEIRQYMRELRKEEIEVMSKDAKGKPVVTYRKMTPTEIEESVRYVYGGALPSAEKPLPVVHSDADYEALPSGSLFTDANGRKYQKP